MSPASGPPRAPLDVSTTDVEVRREASLSISGPLDGRRADEVLSCGQAGQQFAEETHWSTQPCDLVICLANFGHVISGCFYAAERPL